MRLKLAIWGAAFAALFATMAWAGRQTVDARVTVVTDTWTVSNNLATNAALLTTTGLTPAGVLLYHGGGLGICLSAESGQTITSGVMRAYVYMPVADSTTPPTYRWIAYPAQDWTLTASVRDQCKGDMASLSGIGRFAYVEDSVVLSGGTTVLVTYSMRSGTSPQ